MLYYLFDYLAQYNSVFDVFRYLTLRIILAALTALVISLMLGPIVINYLNSKKLYQSIRNDGPKSHIKNKSLLQKSHTKETGILRKRPIFLRSLRDLYF